MRLPVDPVFQFLLSTMAGVFVFLFFVGREYLRGLGWLLGSWDPNMGCATEDELISKANRNALLIAVLLLAWAFMGPSPYRRNWEIEVLGIGTGMLLAYVVIIRLAASRVKKLRG
ncbi:hypothetical protein [Stenotrophomonas sp. 59]|uniref:hypothetical protein n=1 Tax=Stenotrophomonas sp. 59 TaxID=3051120 RepID=UPI00256F55D0|nr:hypothetical protein [Stenotrophomonas sp. 59]